MLVQSLNFWCPSDIIATIKLKNIICQNLWLPGNITAPPFSTLESFKLSDYIHFIDVHVHRHRYHEKFIVRVFYRVVSAVSQLVTDVEIHLTFLMPFLARKGAW